MRSIVHTVTAPVTHLTKFLTKIQTSLHSRHRTLDIRELNRWQNKVGNIVPNVKRNNFLCKDLSRVALCAYFKTSQELQMLSSVTINCQVTKIVMNSGSQLSVL